MYSNGKSVVYLKFCKILENIAQGDGGALYVEGRVDIISSILQDNQTESGRGGALFVGKRSSLSVRQSNFEGNHAWELGPAIFLDLDGSSNIFENNGCGNTASSGDCNGVYAESTGICTSFESTCTSPSEGQFT